MYIYVQVMQVPEEIESASEDEHDSSIRELAKAVRKVDNKVKHLFASNAIAHACMSQKKSRVMDMLTWNVALNSLIVAAAATEIWEYAAAMVHVIICQKIAGRIVSTCMCVVMRR